MQSQRNQYLGLALILGLGLIALLWVALDPTLDTIDYGCYSILLLFLVTLGALFLSSPRHQ